MEIPYKEFFDSLLCLDRPMIILLDRSLSIIAHSRALPGIIEGAEDGKTLNLGDIFPGNDYRIIYNRLVSGQHLNRPLNANINASGLQNRRAKVLIQPLNVSGNGFYLITMDIIDPMFSEKNITENVETFLDLFSRIFEASSYGVILFSQEHRILYFNQWFKKFTGFGYADLGSYDDMVKKLSMGETKRTGENDIMSWNITNRDGINIKFTAVYVSLPALYYMIFLVPWNLEKSREHLNAYNARYLIMSNYALASFNRNSAILNDIRDDISKARESGKTESLNGIIGKLDESIIRMEENIASASSAELSLFPPKTYNMTHSISSIIALFPDNEDKKIILESSVDIELFTPFTEQLDNFFSIIIEDIYTNMSKGTCSIHIYDVPAYSSPGADSDCAGVSFSLKGEISYENMIICMQDTKTPYCLYVASFMELANARVQRQADHSNEMKITVHIPRENKPKIHEKSEPRPESAVNGVLIADDEESVRNIGKMMLEMMGFKVYLAKNGKEAVQEFKSNINSIQLVILDIIMPKLDGQQAFRIIKSLKPEVKVLFASGYYTESILKNMLKGGDALYVVKPFTFEDLLQKVQDLLNHG